MLNITEGYTAQLRGIYNRTAEAGGPGIYYRGLDEREFDGIFGRENRLTLYVNGNFGRPAAFFSASLPNDSGTSYLTYIGTSPEQRGRGYAAALLDAGIKILRDRYSAAKIDTVFYDPSHLPWIIPGSTDGHPCAPGTPSEGYARRLLESRGFSEWCAQIAYYMPLSEYIQPEDLDTKRTALLGKGIEITLYNPEKHRDLYALFDAIGNPGWRSTVMAHTDRPIVVAADSSRDGLVIGYTGPLSQTPEGSGIRGNFCGIGTLPEYRGMGIAKQIFCEMCRLHKAAGATFMSLYTGETMSARRVYEYAGCRPAARFSNLRLKLK